MAEPVATGWQPANFIELSARERVAALLDPGSFTELLDPFARLTSPWLPKQGIVTQFDDGVVIGKGRLNGQPAVVAAIEGAFQGGSLGEVAGAKIAGALELAVEDNRQGIPTCAVLVLETGGVRLQEANLGLAAIAEIHAAIVELRQYQPVIGIITGPVGCFGGMGIAAGLCSYLLMTREGRLGLNGPQVIEQEAGVAEYDSRDRPFIWSLTGGEQRVASTLVDAFVSDDADAVRAATLSLLQQGLPASHRTDRADAMLAALLQLDTAPQISALQARTLLAFALQQHAFAAPQPEAGHLHWGSSRGELWSQALIAATDWRCAAVPSVCYADGELGGRACRFILIRPDASNHFPRARQGEVGLLEGWALTSLIEETQRADAELPVKRALIAIVDVPSQAYGRREEALGIHQALAAAAAAYAGARLAGHPLLSLLVGKAMSGAFLAHGYQANRIFALDDSKVLIHAMGKASAARVTLRSEAELDELAASIPPMAYDVHSFASLGLIERLIPVQHADYPDKADIEQVRQTLTQALQQLPADDRHLQCRLQGEHRGASREVRQRLHQSWQVESH
ncbi:biotin-independent malonate decarboxylase subunit beta [Pokkaliibacter sp. MBI-7]|uniref:biotin-independent malonate decarboxylase subunit beta n=1 Tax=Pokkaliibacter sp. MBI-7 TaxID=3040600 RepID=UPI00244D1807|nr:biotin-independent malonate decarboxylase subunit beta [Pokkaliibacter sp. MBI-7]MDH2434422.1 biotin-independent malonate decarboxylase subunit beta [Pokkaliibacter sp. MBI-7]